MASIRRALAGTALWAPGERKRVPAIRRSGGSGLPPMPRGGRASPEPTLKVQRGRRPWRSGGEFCLTTAQARPIPGSRSPGETFRGTRGEDQGGYREEQEDDPCVQSLKHGQDLL